MATNCYSHLKFFSVCNDGFYFEAPATDVHEDHFKASVCQSQQYLIQSNENQFVIVTEKQFLAEERSDEQHQTDNIFNIKIYNSDCTDGQEYNGIAVMIYAKDKNGKKLMVYHSDDEVRPEPMDLPENIDGNEHRALFYMEKLSAMKYNLRSSCCRDKFLAFKEMVVDNCTLYKLVLRCKESVDEPCEINLVKV
uniref:Interleukin-18 n=1 Tax=Dicentrarchus labrax TaxID=13489 RepID=A0A8P4KG55_DICLA